MASEALKEVANIEGKVNLVNAYIPKQGGPDLGQKLREAPGLFIKSGKLKKKIFFVETTPFRIGRGPNNHLVLTEPQVEPYHAVITKDAEGNFLMSAAVEGTTPLFFREHGSYKKQLIIPLRDRMRVRVGQGGTVIQFRYRGRTIAPTKAEADPRLVAQPLELHDLGPADLKRGLSQLLVKARLNEQERMVVDEAARAMNSLKWFRVVLIVLMVALGLTITSTLFFQQRYRETSAEFSTNQKNWAGAWARMFIEGEEFASAADVVAPEVALDPVTGQIVKVMEGFGFQDYRVDAYLLRDVKEQIDLEVRRVKNGDLDGFLKRYRERHPVIAAALERNYGLPRNFAYLAWVASDYRLDVRNEKQLGMWQFKPGTAEQYGLIVDGGDYRTDFAESTRAAGEFLTDLVTYFGLEHFFLVIAAYQGGEKRVLEAFKSNRLWRDDQRVYEKLCPLALEYNQGLLPEETCRFPMRFLAATIIGENMNFHLRRE